MPTIAPKVPYRFLVHPRQDVDPAEVAWLRRLLVSTSTVADVERMLDPDVIGPGYIDIRAAAAEARTILTDVQAATRAAITRVRG